MGSVGSHPTPNETVLRLRFGSMRAGCNRKLKWGYFPPSPTSFNGGIGVREWVREWVSEWVSEWVCVCEWVRVCEWVSFALIEPRFRHIVFVVLYLTLLSCFYFVSSMVRLCCIVLWFVFGEFSRRHASSTRTSCRCTGFAGQSRSEISPVWGMWCPFLSSYLLHIRQPTW